MHLLLQLRTQPFAPPCLLSQLLPPMAFITPIFSARQHNVRSSCSTVVCAQQRPERTVVSTAAAVALATVASVFIHAHHVEAISLPSLPSAPSLPSLPSLPSISLPDSSESIPGTPKDGTKFTEEQADKVDDMIAKMEAKKKARAAKM